jgi:hypothetical protein
MFNKALFLALLLVAMPVASKSNAKADKALQDSLKSYELAVRWNDFEAASSSLDPLTVEAGESFSNEDETYYKGFQVSGYRVKAAMLIDPQTFGQRVELRVIEQDTQIERLVIDRQRWRYDPESKRWWLTTGLPKLD